MVSQPRNTPTLEGRIQALAEELQDHIMEFTVAVDTNEIITVTADYKPPLGLQVNSKLRRELARNYFSNNVFYFPDDEQVAGHWMRAQQPDHVQLLEELRINAYHQIFDDCDSPPPTDLQKGNVMVLLMNFWLGDMEDAGLSLNFGVLKVDWNLKKPDGTREMKWLSIGELAQLLLRL